MRNLPAAALAVALGTFATQAGAVTFAGGATGSFGSFSPGRSAASAAITNTSSSATFAFGAEPVSTIVFSGYADGTGFFGDVDQPFAIGDVSATLNPVTSYPQTGTSVILTTILTFAAPVAVTRTLTFTLDIGLHPGLADGTQDAEVFGTPDVTPATFDYAGTLYDVSLVGFDPDGFDNDLSLVQGETISGQLFAQVSVDPAPVPEPASLLLLAVGGLAAAVTRAGRRA